jgi:protein-disulfide isomerase
MTCNRAFTVLTLSLMLANSLSAQSQKPTAVAQATCGPTREGISPCAEVEPIAVVNGQPLTIRDLDPKTQQVVGALETELAKARRDVLNAHLDNMLLETVAQKRKMTPEQLYNKEIVSRLVPQTEEQVKAEYENHPKDYGAFDYIVVRDFITGKLRDRQEQQLFDSWLAVQRRRFPVVRGVDINTPSLKPSATLATFNGRKITLNALSERLKPALYSVRQNAYESEKSALDHAINNLLLKVEAKRRGVSPEDVLNVEIKEKTHPPTDEEIQKFYDENSWRFKGKLPSARAQVVAYIEKQESEELERKFYEQLRAAAAIRLLLTEPERPVQRITTERSPASGNAGAPVTIVEFGDFQCMPCGAMHAIIKEASKPYGDKVRFVFRQYPLSMHPRAQKAAEAALAAHAQGKFWEYADLLFKNQRALGVASLKKYAAQVGLDQALFDHALDGELYAAEVRRDIRDGQLYGVTATPILFINGLRLPYSEHHADGVKKAIDAALKQANQPRKRART